MATCTRDLPPWAFEVMATSGEEMLIWEPSWHPVTGVSVVDFTPDVKNITLGAMAAIAMKPAVQYAAVRTDRPGVGAAISAGSPITANGVTHFEETLSGATQFFFRRGWSYELTAGSFARAEVLLYTSFRSCGHIFPTKEIAFNPTNDTNVPSYFPAAGPFSAVGVDKAKFAVIGMDNLNTDLEWRMAGRAFNDPLARGPWTDLESAWNAPGSGDFSANTGEVDLSGLSLGSNHWMELALAVRKGSGGDPNSRCLFHVIPAIKYT